MLADAGVSTGERVFLMLPRVIGWYDVLLGAVKLGAIPMRATVQLKGKDVAYRINKAGASVAVTDAAGAEVIDSVRDQCPTLTTVILMGGRRDGWIDGDRAREAAVFQEHVKQVTAPYKYPRHVEFIDELPKTVSGKIRRVELRSRN